MQVQVLWQVQEVKSTCRKYMFDRQEDTEQNEKIYMKRGTESGKIVDQDISFIDSHWKVITQLRENSGETFIYW